MSMSREQLIDIILSAYDARKETKEYFEFFLNPDVTAMMSKCEDVIIKECNKSRRGGYAKFRISAIKRLLKDFQGLNPGVEYVLKMMLIAIHHMVWMTARLYISDKQYDSIIKYISDTLTYADRNSLYQPAVTTLLELANREQFQGRYIRHAIITTIEDHTATLK